MNPIEQIWKQIRSMGFKNEVFNTLNDVMEIVRNYKSTDKK